ncbi:hypothetical protein C7G42_02725 [Bradyrhizobium sp. MOS003]|nr:hypothetical protein C7G42_02725 [Bradyrhizobium sp. MOS003]
MRAQRSNAESLHGDGLDCFAALAMTSLLKRRLPVAKRLSPASAPSPPRARRWLARHWPP